MPIFRLTKKLAFPPPGLADEEGLLAVGGDLREKRLLLAYSMGIFPWYSEGDPILWWSPDPRMILIPGRFRLSKRLRRIVRSGRFTVTADQAFDDVLDSCATVPRPGQDGTWITPQMRTAYRRLHRSGYAHSVECWEEGTLAGGLYGISLGSCFFGESMFSNVANASKVALSALVAQSLAWDFTLIDCQVHTDHLLSLGACNIERREFLVLLAEGLKVQTRAGHWTLDA